MDNLDSNTNLNTGTPINNVQSKNNTSQRIQSCDKEVNDSFCLPRKQPAQRQNGPVRSGNGRFAPYRNRDKKANDSKESQANHIMKDVCLLPSPNWDAVPRRRLVRQNMFVNARTLDKTWSEEQL